MKRSVSVAVALALASLASAAGAQVKIGVTVSSTGPAASLGIPSEKVVINIERFGNTTGGTIPLALNDAVESQRLKEGDLLLIASVGAGFTVGAILMRWGLKR